MEFVDVKNDVAFRKIFGNENRKESLISFLNAILAFEGKQKIVSVEILNPYQLPKLRGGKVTIVDVKATDKAKRTYIVEMQVADIDYFDKRVLYYCSKSYSDQIKRGDLYKKLKPVFFIGILDFVHTQNPNFISRNQIKDVETGEQTIHDLEFTFIELPKFELELKDCRTLTEKWIYFLKNAENLEVIPKNVTDKGLKSAYEEANKHSWTQAELDAYDYVYMRQADEEGKWSLIIKKEKALSKIEAKMETALEIARNLISKSADDLFITEITGLTLEQIQELRNKLK